MTIDKEEIIQTIGSSPEDLISFYEVGEMIVYPSSRINCLEFKKALQYTRDLQYIPIVNRMGLWALDDANDSNPFCYIGRGPCKGAIIKFSHDPEPEIYFSILKNFLFAIEAIAEIDSDIDEIKRESEILFPLAKDIEELCNEDTDDSISLINIYLPVCCDLNENTKSLLVSHPVFFVRESFAVYLLKHPAIEDLVYSEQLANDDHPQVTNPGKKARSAINKIKWKG